MNSVWFAVPGDLATPTGGYVYDRRMIDNLRTLGWHVDIIDLGSGFPRPSMEQKATALAVLAKVPVNAPVVVDGLALGVLPEAAEELAASHRLIALVHHPLAYESGLSVVEADCLRKSERRALAAVRAVIVTSDATARLLHREYDVPVERITVIVPGNDRMKVNPREPKAELALLAVGAIVPRKGHDVLVAALAPLRHLPWRLTIVGDCTRDPDTVSRLKSHIQSFGLASQVTLAGAIPDEELIRLYAAADLFVLASRFEGYGIAISEAISYGLPVVSTTAGAIPDTLPQGAGLLVPPDDIDALSGALRQLVEQPGERHRLAAAARDAALMLPSWRQAAERFSDALRAVA